MRKDGVFIDPLLPEDRFDFDGEPFTDEDREGPPSGGK